MEKEPYRPGLSKDTTLVEHLKELQRNPRSLVFAALAERYRVQGLVRQALEILDEGLAEHPDFASALVTKAKCCFDLRRYADCLGILEKVLAKNPENIRAEKLRAEVFQRLGQRKAAVGALTRVISLMPNDRASIKSLEQLANLEAVSTPHAEPALNSLVGRQPQTVGQLQDFLVQTVGEADLGAMESLRPRKVAPALDSAANISISPVISNASGEDTAADGDAVAADWSDEDEAESNNFGDFTYATRTVADLYLRQGLNEKARKVLELMVKKDKTDSWARETLQKLSPSSGNTNAPPAKRTQLMLKAQYLERLLAKMQSVKRVTN